MEPATFCHVMAPTRVLRGPGSWASAAPFITSLGQRPLLVGRSGATASLRQRLFADLQRLGCSPVRAELIWDCCDDDLASLEQTAVTERVDLVIAAGGGKVLDAGKLVGHRLALPVVTVPTSAATCAGWTALSNLYSPSGAFRGDVALDRCPDLLVFDHDLLMTAPARTLASGIADAMAKWYEASVSSGASDDGLIQQAVQLARVLRDQLLLEGIAAVNHPGSPAWVRVAEACGLSAGLIGGLGGARCRTVAAHAVHNGLTQLPACHDSLHGEKVGFGILAQLRLEETLGGNGLAAQARRQLLPFLQQLGLPVTLHDLGLARASLSDLHEVCTFACRPGSDLHHLPFAVSTDDLLAALVTTSQGVAVTRDGRA